MANCLRRCDNLGITINWELFYLSVKRYGLVDNKNYIAPKSISVSKNICPPSSMDKIIRPHQDKKEPHPTFAAFYLKAMENASES